MKSLVRFISYFFAGILITSIIGAIAGGESVAAAAATIFFVAFIYLIPAFLAFSRKSPDKLAITALNVLLGWTVIGWVGSLIWAFKNFDYVPPALREKNKD